MIFIFISYLYFRGKDAWGSTESPTFFKHVLKTDSGD